MNEHESKPQFEESKCRCVGCVRKRGGGIVHNGPCAYKPCAGPAYPDYSKPCPDNAMVIRGKGWCSKCLPRTNIA